MARGKYSPTVNAAYAADQKWWSKFADGSSMFDPDGFDSYGYDKNDCDRAGNNEFVYLSNDATFTYDGPDGDWNNAYEDALDAWGFDGTKPTLRTL